MGLLDVLIFTLVYLQIGNGITTIYKNGVIYTVDVKTTWWKEPKSALVVEDGIIRYVGDDTTALAYNKDGVKVIDLEGRTVLPGLHDVHTHPLEAGDSTFGCALLKDSGSPEGQLETIKTCAQNTPGSGWVLGSGHSISDLLDYMEKGGSPRDLLDSAVGDRPAAMLEETGHSVWVNSKALELAGFLANATNPPGGVIMRDEETGEPNGILLENAGDILVDTIMDPLRNPELMDRQYEGLLESLDLMAENGITSTVDCRCYWRRNHHLTWDRVQKEGHLTVRAILALIAYPHLSDSQIQDLKSLYKNENPFLRRTQIKFFLDGILETTTAAMLSPYKIDLGLGLGTNNTGMNPFTPGRLPLFLRELQEAGFDFVIHAIGDRGVEEAVTAIEQVKRDGVRYRITHLEVVNQREIHRMAASNIIGDLQVAGDWTLPEDVEERLDEFIDEEKIRSFIPVNTILQAGVKVTLSSDYDVSTINPFIGLKHAIDRGEESVDLHEAVEMYTINAAYVMRQETVTGSLELGKAADLIVISENIFENEDKIEETEVLLTLLAGNQVYRRDGYNLKFIEVEEDAEVEVDDEEEDGDIYDEDE